MGKTELASCHLWDHTFHRLSPFFCYLGIIRQSFPHLKNVTRETYLRAGLQGGVHRGAHTHRASTRAREPQRHRGSKTPQNPLSHLTPFHEVRAFQQDSLLSYGQGQAPYTVL